MYIMEIIKSSLQCDQRAYVISPLHPHINKSRRLFVGWYVQLNYMSRCAGINIGNN